MNYDNLQETEIHIKSDEAPIISKRRRSIAKLFAILSGIVFTFVLLVGGFIVFHNVYYTPFYVSGASMYPTLNGDSKNAAGELIGSSHSVSRVGDIVDYGIMDTSKRAIDGIDRFDIIVTYYKSDFNIIDGKYVLSTTADSKIKRVIGLPGETLRIEENGDLYINDEYVAQDFISDEYVSMTGEYSEILIGSDNYFVMGDNRNKKASSDSREDKVGTIQQSFILGKVVAIEGVCTIAEGGGIYNITYFWPKFF